MKKISKGGNRQSGKTTTLIDSILSHITDQRTKPGASLIVSGANYLNTRYLNKLVIEKLTESKIGFIANGDKILVENKRVSFVAPQMQNYICVDIDFIFLDDVEQMESNFMEFIDTIIRPHVVVIQTRGGDKALNKFKSPITIE